MEWIVSHQVPLVFLSLYVLLLLYHAWIGHRSTRGVVDYYVGGRRMGGWALGLSFFATYSSTNSFIGLAGQSYSFGVGWFWLVAFLVGFSILSWLFVAPRLRRLTEQFGSLTVSDFLGFRFSSRAVRCAAAVIIIFSSLFYMTAIFKGAGELLAAFLDLPYTAAVFLIFVMVVFYTYVGGFISVVKTDGIQGGMMIAAAIFLFAATYTKVDGWSGVVETLSAQAVALPDGRPLAEGLLSLRGAVPPLVLLGFIFGGSIKFLVEPRQLSRFYALRNARAVRRGLVASTAAFALVYVCILPLGLLARALYPTGIQDTDRIVPLLLTEGEIVGPHLGAFFLVVLLAAAMSSLDSVLLVVASSWQRDLIEVWRPSQSEAQMLARTRFYVLLLAILTMLIALRPPGGIVALTVFSGSIYAACFLPALLLGLFWRRGSALAVLASFAIGVSTLIAWPALTQTVSGLRDTHEVFPAVLLSMGIYLAASLLTRPSQTPARWVLFGHGQWGAGAEE